MSASNETLENFEALKANEYPGRGIVLGRMSTGNVAQIYWVMGRSEGSRNRLLVEKYGVVKTEPFDDSKVDEAQRDLIIYNATGTVGTKHIVSNGKQTDGIVRALQDGGTFDHELRVWEHEPDAPIYTPRISGLVDLSAGLPYELSVINKHPTKDKSERHFYRGTLQEVSGEGVCVHTYAGNAPEGQVVPSFEGDPYSLPLGDTIQDTAEMYWDALNHENRVALVVKEIDPHTGIITHNITNQLGN